MSIEAIEPIAVVNTYDELLAALRQRVIDLGTSLAVVEDVAGLPANHATKVLNGTRRFGPMSLSAVIGALGLKLAIVPTTKLSPGSDTA
jgi:hypothetical protein